MYFFTRKIRDWLTFLSNLFMKFLFLFVFLWFHSYRYSQTNSFFSFFGLISCWNSRFKYFPFYIVGIFMFFVNFFWWQYLVDRYENKCVLVISQLTIEGRLSKKSGPSIKSLQRTFTDCVTNLSLLSIETRNWYILCLHLLHQTPRTYPRSLGTVSRALLGLT